MGTTRTTVATEISGRLITAGFRHGRKAGLALIQPPNDAVSADAGNGRFAVPPAATWFRMLRVPVGPLRVRRRVIAFETSRAFPVPLSEVAWDACPAAGEGAELLVGMKTADARERERTLRSVGFELERLEPVAGALYRCFRYNEPGEQRPGLIVDQSRGGFQVILVDGSRWTVRAVTDAAGPVGRMGAERIHLEMARLLAGLDRNREIAWARMSGDQAGSGPLIRELGGLLRVPVESLDPLRRVSLPPGWVVPTSGPICAALPELVGLAVPPLAGERALNLLPADLQRESVGRRRQPVLVAASALVALSLGTLAVKAGRRADVSVARADQLNRDLPLRLEAQRGMKRERGRIDELQARIERAQVLFVERDRWASFLADLQQALDLAGDAWIDRLVPDPKGPVDDAFRVVVEGRLLERREQGTDASHESAQRMQRMLAQLAVAPSVARIAGERFSPADPGVLRFEIILEFTSSWSASGPTI